jgi:hypothetical protein
MPERERGQASPIRSPASEQRKFEKSTIPAHSAFFEAWLPFRQRQTSTLPMTPIRGHAAVPLPHELLAASVFLLERDLLRAAADVSPARNGIVRQAAME